jgi:hypothetical protein
MIGDPDRVETDRFGARAQTAERLGVDRQRGVERLAARRTPRALARDAHWDVETELHSAFLCRLRQREFCYSPSSIGWCASAVTSILSQ